MKSLLVLVFCAALLTQCHVLAVEESDLNLELASVVFRHGDRSPSSTFPTDEYEESDWPQGYGQLSIVGMQQQYRLGELLRQRYIQEGGCSGLLCANYKRVQVAVRSTDVDHTLMSVESQLAALFPPGRDQVFHSGLAWQPIPVHTVPIQYDSLLQSNALCLNYYVLQIVDRWSPEYQAMEDEYKEFFDFLTDKTGMEVNLGNSWIIGDVVFIESVSPGYNEPSWATEEVLKNLSILADYAFTSMYNSKEEQRLSAGNFVGKLASDMREKSDAAGNTDIKLYLYSAHDTTVSAVASALDIFNEKRPGYATAITIELYSDPQGEYFVRMFKREGPDSDTFEPLSAPYCNNATLCTLEEFESFVAPLVPSDLEEECNPRSGGQNGGGEHHGRLGSGKKHGFGEKHGFDGDKHGFGKKLGDENRRVGKKQSGGKKQNKLGHLRIGKKPGGGNNHGFGVGKRHGFGIGHDRKDHHGF